MAMAMSMSILELSMKLTWAIFPASRKWFVIKIVPFLLNVISESSVFLLPDPARSVKCRETDSNSNKRTYALLARWPRLFFLAAAPPPSDHSSSSDADDPPGKYPTDKAGKKVLIAPLAACTGGFFGKSEEDFVPFDLALAFLLGGASESTDPDSHPPSSSDTTSGSPD